MIVGVDNAGAWRPFDYLPFPPGEAGGFRPEAATWYASVVSVGDCTLISSALAAV